VISLVFFFIQDRDTTSLSRLVQSFLKPCQPLVMGSMVSAGQSLVYSARDMSYHYPLHTTHSIAA
jgi:hypothetical protein